MCGEPVSFPHVEIKEPGKWIGVYHDECAPNGIHPKPIQEPASALTPGHTSYRCRCEECESIRNYEPKPTVPQRIEELQPVELGEGEYSYTLVDVYHTLNEVIRAINKMNEQN